MGHPKEKQAEDLNDLTYCITLVLTIYGEIILIDNVNVWVPRVPEIFI